MQAPLKAKTYPRSIRADWNPALQNLEMPKPGTESLRGKLLEMKMENEQRFPRKEKKQADFQSKNVQISAPELLRNFNGNAYMNRVPNDNDVAISNAGQVVSVINSSFFIYDTAADSLQLTFSFDAFAAPLELPEIKYDPRVIYDPNADRFIAVILNGFLDSTSQIIVAFTTTNDATGEWNLYTLPGNPNNNGTWSDYPTIGISASELFIGINTFTNGSVNNSGFVESVFWQVDLANGYNGEALSTAYYSNILPPNNRPIFNITPVRDGLTIAGDEMYLLSNRNLSTENDTFFLLKVSGRIPNANLSVQTLKAEGNYYMAPRARQASNRTFDTMDNRVTFAFKQNGIIQFVQNTLDTTRGTAGIYHGFILDYENNPSIRHNILSDTVDLGYATLNYLGNGAGDNRAIITVNHSSPTVFSGCSAYSFDGTSNYSQRLQVKEGENFVSVGFGTFNRWGDYSGAQRKYNEDGVVWMAGSYGRSNRTNGTWIAELKWLDDSFVGISENQSEHKTPKVFPNPSMDQISVSFVAEKSELMSFKLYDIQGRLVKIILKDLTKKGENLFSFSTQPLPAGTYILRIESASGMVHQQKIIRQ
ncbi:MAG: T9SS type A sorting domain-containing protein [Flavobacteriales bacterium]